MYIDSHTVFLGVACAASAFFGVAACAIFSVPWPASWQGRVYLFWFNFCGSAFGWGALGVLFNRLGPQASADAVTLGDCGLALVAFAGITGHLPMATMGIFRGLGNLAITIYKKWFSDAV